MTALALPEVADTALPEPPYPRSSHTALETAAAVVAGAVISAALGMQGAPMGLTRAERARLTRELLDTAAREPHRRAQAHSAVVVLNSRVADAVASRFRDRGVPIEDLRQAAYEGLTRAVSRYDANLACDLLTFAVPTIRGEVQRYLRDRAWLVRPPREVHELVAKINAATSDLLEENGRMPDAKEVCKYLGITRNELETTQRVMSQVRCESLDRSLTLDQSAGTVLDLLDASRLYDGDDEIERAETRVMLEPALRSLSQRDQRFIELRFYAGRSYREIGAELGVSDTQAARQVQTILRRMRDRMESKRTH